MRAALTLALALACSSPEAPGPAPHTDDKHGDMLVLAIPFDPGNVNPLVLPYALSGTIQDLVQPGLVRRQVDESGLLYEPALAESWAWSEDGATLTYTLRADLAWEDGQPLTSADAAFSWELIADPAVASNWFGNAKFVTAVDTPDPRTVIYRFDAPRNPILQQGYTMRGIVPKHVLADADRATLRGHPSGRAPLASGPFRVASWDPGQKVVLEPNPRAPLGWQPKLDRIVVKVVPEYSTRLLELRNGDVDMLLDVQANDIPTVQADPRLTLITIAAQSMVYIGYNQTKPRFADKNLRTALTYALDREALIDELLMVGGERHGSPCIGTIAPTLGAWYADDVRPLPFDLAEARRLLGEAGWGDADRNGILDRGGEPLEFRLMVQTGDADMHEIAIRTQAAWKQVGVSLQIDEVEPTRFAELARTKQYDAVLWSFGANPKVDPSMEWRSDGQYNWFGYHNPEVDAYIDKGTAATDLSVSQDAFRQVQRLVHADQPVTFLYWGDAFIAVDKRFQNVEPNTFTALNHAERWWVAADQQKYRRR